MNVTATKEGQIEISVDGKAASLNSMVPVAHEQMKKGNIIDGEVINADVSKTMRRDIGVNIGKTKSMCVNNQTAQSILQTTVKAANLQYKNSTEIDAYPIMDNIVSKSSVGNSVKEKQCEMKQALQDFKPRENSQEHEQTMGMARR